MVAQNNCSTRPAEVVYDGDVPPHAHVATAVDQAHLRYALADLYRHLGVQIATLHTEAMGMSPEHESTWDLLALAARLEDEQRLIGQVLDDW